MDCNYGSSKGSIARGTRVFDSKTGPDHRYHYTDEVVDQEVVATGDGIVANFANITLAYRPVRPGTLQITDGAQIVRDDGNGNLVGDIAAGVNSVNYVNGAVDVTFAAVAAVGSITATYEYDMEGNSQLPELDLQLTSAPVIARTQKLVARWSLEAQQDLQAYLQQNLEVEIVGYMTNMIAKELNTKIIRHIRSIANGGTAVWDRTPPTGVQYILHKPTFYDSLIALSNSIFARTQRMEPNWIVAGVQVCNVIETMGDLFTRSGSAGTKIVGVRKIGTLGQFDIYKDPSYPACEYLMGCKGANFLDAGYIWSPYLMLYTTPPITLEDMVVRRGMMQRTGTKVINSLFFATGSVVQQGGEFGGATPVGPRVCSSTAPGGTALPPGSEHIVQ